METNSQSKKVRQLPAWVGLPDAVAQGETRGKNSSNDLIMREDLPHLRSVNPSTEPPPAPTLTINAELRQSRMSRRERMEYIALAAISAGITYGGIYFVTSLR